jgi:hypothetical protein
MPADGVALAIRTGLITEHRTAAGRPAGRGQVGRLVPPDFGVALLELRNLLLLFVGEGFAGWAVRRRVFYRSTPAVRGI